MADATLPQEIQVLTLISKENYPREFAQRLISNWGAIQVIGRGEIDQATFKRAVRKVPNPFAVGRTELRWFYLDGWKPTTVAEQLTVLQGFYPNLDGSHVVEIASGMGVSEDADGLFVVPKLSSVAAKLGIENPFGKGYGQMLEASVLAHLTSQRKFYHRRGGWLAPDRVRVGQSAADAIHKLEEKTPGDFLVFPAQTGLNWGGYSLRNALWEIEHSSESEFPLPAWCVGHIILTNPTRLDRHEILWIDCPGDEYRFGDDAEFYCFLSFFFNDGQLKLGNGWLNHVQGNRGSASGFFG